MSSTYADLSFVPWCVTVQQGCKQVWDSWEVEKKYPDFSAWYARLLERPSVKKIYGL